MTELSQLHHVGITVTDVDRSAAFYSSLFALDEVARFEMEGPLVAKNLDVPDAKIVVLLMRSRSSTLELIQYLTPVGKPFELRNSDIGATHVCFTVEDIDAFSRELTSRGIISNGQPNDPIPDGPAAGSRFMYFRDPDGITVEVLQPGGGIQV